MVVVVVVGAAVVVGAGVVVVGAAVVVVGAAVAVVVGAAVVVVGAAVVVGGGVVVPGVMHSPFEQTWPFSQQMPSQKGGWFSGADGPHSKHGPPPKNELKMQDLAWNGLAKDCIQKLIHAGGLRKPPN